MLSMWWDVALLFCGCEVFVVGVVGGDCCCVGVCGGDVCGCGMCVLWLTQFWIGSITVVFAAPIFGGGENSDLAWLMG